MHSHKCGFETGGGISNPVLPLIGCGELHSCLVSSKMTVLQAIRLVAPSCRSWAALAQFLRLAWGPWSEPERLPQSEEAHPRQAPEVVAASSRLSGAGAQPRSPALP